MKRNYSTFIIIIMIIRIIIIVLFHRLLKLYINMHTNKS